MIEMLGVLAIIGVLSAGGIMGYSVAMENHKVNQTIDDMNTIIANAITIFSGKTSSSHQWVGADKLLALGIIPTRYKNSLTGSCDTRWTDCYIKSLFNNAFRIAYLDNYRNQAIGDKIMWFQLGNISKNVCFKLLQYDWFKSKDSQYRVLAKTKTAGGVITRFTSQPTKSTAEALCSDTSYLDFEFYF